VQELLIIVRAPEADHPADVRPTVSASDPLQETAYASGHLGQHDRIDVADIDADFQGRCSNADTIAIGSHLLFNALALRGRQGPKVKMYWPSRANELLVEMRRHCMRAVARVGEDEHFLRTGALKPDSKLPRAWPWSR
jgi:hypothetical protein